MRVLRYHMVRLTNKMQINHTKSFDDHDGIQHGRVVWFFCHVSLTCCNRHYILVQLTTKISILETALHDKSLEITDTKQSKEDAEAKIAAVISELNAMKKKYEVEAEKNISVRCIQKQENNFWSYHFPHLGTRCLMTILQLIFF